VKILMFAALVLGGLLIPGQAAANHTSAAVLPDLAMLQPADFRLENLGGGGRRLRFSTVIVNLGPGRFDVYGSNPDPTDATRLTRVTQRLQQNSGWAEHPTEATMFYAGDGHNHWHVYGLQDWALTFAATPNERLATGAKTGFCFWDNVNLSNAPKYYSGSAECRMNASGTVPMGLSASWGDRYSWNIAFQYIDISHLPYGDYCLTQTADPLGQFVETTKANNQARTLISITSNGVTVLAANCGDTPATSVHVADLEGSARAKGKSGRWEASVTVTVHDQSNARVGGAAVTGRWSGASGTVAGTTAVNGSVKFSTGSMTSDTPSISFTVVNVSAGSSAYDPAANTDLDRDSNGTTITVSRPF
jgi:hypothetical protein